MIETLLKSNGFSSEERWYPEKLEKYKSLLRNGSLANMEDEVRRNLGYSLQYLEFLNLQIEELVFSSVIEKMILKNFIIVAVSIVEAILEEIVKNNNWQTKEYFEVIGDAIDSNVFTDQDGSRKKIRTEILKELAEPKDVQMKFDDIIKKIKNRNKKKKVLSLNHDELLALDRFRKLRNKVHLSNIESGKTNWHEFSKLEYVTVKFLLYSILTDDGLENNNANEVVKFLKPKDDEMTVLASFKRFEEK
ncbi:TPA: hypothetical protein ACGORW_001039 [Streptococcus suis]|uniref:hypothetical protein n=1 Tax=Streptococcus suis TaxID=1307 RepID=UPI001D23A81B|nr:hypothetical protein [Streptococcus suis]HEM6266085.1 hypothetical protein [Streptococcus suis]